MALAAAHPVLVNFVDHLVSGGSPEDDSLLAEIQITGDRLGLAGRTIAEAYGSLDGVRVLGLEHVDGRFTIGPNGDTLLAEGDRLMLYGDQTTISSIAEGLAS